MAIKAHLEPTAPGEGQRATPRRDLRLEASGVLPSGREANVVVHNISASGLLLETGLDLATGEQLALDLPEAGSVEAMIMWRSEQLYGCAFAAPLGAAALAAAQLQGLPVTEAASTVIAAGAQPAGADAGEALGLRLNRLRREAGLTLADVALRLGVSKPTVWAWEKGKARPLPERIDAIAEALGVSSGELAETRGASADIGLLIEDCRKRIAEACSTTPGAVRIMIEM
ncbi:helix-turn-helix domain-containing protein [Erythrobacter sp. NFXS35]|uniref:helix-turn-helix domain-containing protein n=1 Tax=Erythrobacter sp. NFXS35 TaxID=2818436 RepID=UPI0032DEB5D0